MRVAVCSDLHLEFGNLELKNTEKADVLILSGDICVAHSFSEKPQFLDFFEQVCGEFPHVVYIMGNHEHYSGDFAQSEQILKFHLAHLKNLHILEKETFELGEYLFIGGTLWTDMNGGDATTLHFVSSAMNDFRIVKNSNRMTHIKVPVYEEENGQLKEVGMRFKELVSTFSPSDAVEDHKKFVDYIQHVIKNNPDKKIVVVGHHAPSKLSTHPRYQNDTLMNGGYSSSLDFFIEDHPQIVLWTHGHTHETFDYEIGKTRIVCNPRGYINYEDRADRFELRFIDV